MRGGEEHGRRLVLQGRPGWPVDNPAARPPTTGCAPASRTRAKGGRNGKDKTEGIMRGSSPGGRAKLGWRRVMSAGGWVEEADPPTDDPALGHRCL